MASAKRDRGFALLLVVIMLATLSLIVAASVDAGRRYGDETWSRLEDLRLRAAADAGFWTAARDLVEAGAARPEILSHKQSYEIDGIRLTVSARSEAGKIDINAAPSELIAALLVQSGLKPERAARLTDEIADWRDGDNDTRKNGAEVADYIAAGRSYGPTNRAFESNSELALVLDGGENLARCLADDVTVFTRQTDVTPEAASERVARAAKLDPAHSRPSAVSIVGGRAVDTGELVDIDVTADDKSAGRSLSEQTTVRITGSQSDPVWILARVSPTPGRTETEAACKEISRG